MSLSSLEKHFHYHSSKESYSNHLTRVAKYAMIGCAVGSVTSNALPAIAATISTIALPHLLATGALLSTVGYLSSGRTLPLRMTSYAFSTASGSTLAITLLAHATAIPWFILFAGAAASLLWTSSIERKQNLRTMIDIYLRNTSAFSEAIDKTLLLTFGHTANDKSTPLELRLRLYTFLIQGGHGYDEKALELVKEIESPQNAEIAKPFARLLVALVNGRCEGAYPIALREITNSLFDVDSRYELCEALIDIRADAYLETVTDIALDNDAPPKLRLSLLTLLIQGGHGYNEQALALLQSIESPQNAEIARPFARLLVALVNGRCEGAYPIALREIANSLFDVDSRYKLCEALIDINADAYLKTVTGIARDKDTPPKLRLSLHILFMRHNPDVACYTHWTCALLQSIESPQNAETAKPFAQLLIRFVKECRKDIYAVARKAITNPFFDVDSRYELCEMLIRQDQRTERIDVLKIARDKDTPQELRLRLYNFICRSYTGEDYYLEALTLIQSIKLPQNAKAAESLTLLLQLFICSNYKEAYAIALQAIKNASYSISNRYLLCRALISINAKMWLANVAGVAEDTDTPTELRLRLYDLFVWKDAENYKEAAFALAQDAAKLVLNEEIATALAMLLLRLSSAEHYQKAYDLAYKQAATNTMLSEDIRLCLCRALPEANHALVAAIAQNKDTSMKLRLQLYILLVQRANDYCNDALLIVRECFTAKEHISTCTTLLTHLIRRGHWPSITYTREATFLEGLEPETQTFVKSKLRAAYSPYY